MTQKKADSDPWLTDPISRDREIAKTVVYGMRTIISLLRAIRDESANENKALRSDLREARQEIRDLWEYAARKGVQTTGSAARFEFPQCAEPQCSLPQDHTGNHRGGLRDA